MDRLKQRLTTTTIFIIFSLFFGLLFLFSTPLLWGSDETSHVGRVYQIAHGHAFAKVVHQGYSGYGFGGTIPANLMKVVDYVNYDFNANSHQVIPGVKWVDTPSDYQKFRDLPLAGKQLQYNFSNTAVYSPVSYAPHVVGFKIAEIFKLRIGPTIYLSRFAGLLFYIALIAYVLKSMSALRAKWLVFTVALLPMALFQAATINGDTVTIALAITITGLVIKSLQVRNRFTRTDAAVLITSTVCMPIVKPSYIFISLLALLVPAARLQYYGRFKKYVMPAAVILGIIAYAIWQYKTRYLSNAPKWIIAGVVPWWQDIDSSRQIAYMLHHPLTFASDYLRTLILTDNIYFDSMIGRLGFDYVQVPAVAILTSVVAMVLSVLSSERFKRSKQGLIIISSVICVSFVAVFATLYLTISSVGSTTIQGVQGRYLYPILPVFLLLLAYATHIRLSLTAKLYRNLTITLCALVFTGLLLSFLKFFYITWG